MGKIVNLILLILSVVSTYQSRIFLGRIQRGEYVPSSTTISTLIFNKSCSQCLCLAFLFNQSQNYQALNCHEVDGKCVLFRNISTWSTFRSNPNSSVYFLASAFKPRTTTTTTRTTSTTTSTTTRTTTTRSTTTTTTTTSTSTVDNRLNATTGRYWGCCKASCSWPGKAAVTSPARSCQADGYSPIDPNSASSCDGGPSFMCAMHQPWDVNATFSYGYVGAYISGRAESDWCCACYSLQFTSGPVQGKEMIVQAINTAYSPTTTFVLQIPGSGWISPPNACVSQFGNSFSWGSQYNGVSSRADCANLPADLQRGCYWRFDWFMNSDYPSVRYREVPCPSILTGNTDCVRY